MGTEDTGTALAVLDTTSQLRGPSRKSSIRSCTQVKPQDRYQFHPQNRNLAKKAIERNRKRNMKSEMRCM
ncbi:hypothetical protein D3C75_1147900 [compost metagenome]